MRWNLVKVIAIAAAIALVSGTTFMLSQLSENGSAFNPVSEEESLEIALEYLKNSPTFRFDGMEDTLKHVETHPLDTPYSWEFVFTFKSRHAGYGDRTGQILAQVITPHTAHIIVQEGKVVSATLDDQWDTMKQAIIT